MPNSAPVVPAEPGVTPRSAGGLRVGEFRFYYIGQRWEWSDEVARMHGYEPGSVTPSTELLLSHKHPDDIRHVQDLLDHALHNGGSFSSRHRFLDTAGVEHTVIVIADRMHDGNGAVIGTEGYYVELTEALDRERRHVLDEKLPSLFAARASIEQAKGALMLVYKIDAEQAFTLLTWRSQETNTKLRVLADQVVAELSDLDVNTDALRRRFDHMLLTVHQRVSTTMDGETGGA